MFKADNYQMRTALYTNDLNDPSEITSFMAYYPSYESNRSGFRNAELEDLFVKSQSEMDVEKRRAEYRRMQEIYIQAAPMVFLLEVPYAVAFRKTGPGLRADPAWQRHFSGVHIEQ